MLDVKKREYHNIEVKLDSIIMEAEQYELDEDMIAYLRKAIKKAKECKEE